MPSVIKTLSEAGVTAPEKWIADNVVYEVQTGSFSYGMADASSDMDIVAVVMNKKSDFFPNLVGHINGFGDPHKVFTTWQHHHIQHESGEYDITAYGLAKWFSLLAENNPNMVDILFSPLHCVRVNTPVSQHIRTNRELFLHRGCKHKFAGYAYAQLQAIGKKDKEGKRAELIAKYGFDTKSASHVVRLALECEQILSEGTLDLTRHADRLKAIRRGEVTEEEIRSFFAAKERYLDELYEKSVLPMVPDMDKIRNLLLECIELHYGSVAKLVSSESRDRQTMREIRALVEKAGI